MLYLIPDPRHLISNTGTCHAILITWYLTPVFAMLYLSLDIRHRYLPCYTYHLISDTGTYHAILITWYPTPIFAMLHLSLDIRYRYLLCYTYHLIPNTGTCHAILITWYLTPVLTMLYLTVDMLLLTWHAITWYQYTWPDIVTPDWLLFYLASVLYCIFMILTFTGTWLLYCYQTFDTPVLLNSYILEPLKKGDSRYYSPIDPRNEITMNMELLRIPCGHYYWTILIIRQLASGWGKLMSTDIVSMFMMVL